MTVTGATAARTPAVGTTTYHVYSSSVSTRGKQRLHNLGVALLHGDVQCRGTILQRTHTPSRWQHIVRQPRQTSLMETRGHGHRWGRRCTARLHHIRPLTGAASDSTAPPAMSTSTASTLPSWLAANSGEMPSCEGHGDGQDTR